MEYLDQYKNFVSTIKDPLERLDDIEVFIEEYEWRSDRIEESHAQNQKDVFVTDKQKPSPVSSPH